MRPRKERSEHQAKLEARALVSFEHTQAVYANQKQQLFLASRAKRKTMVAGRGTGKSYVCGMQTGISVTELPGAKALLAGLTFQHILTKTLPGMIKAWRAMGFREYDPEAGAGHYILFRQPPRGWERAVEPPQSYKYVVSFFTGYCLELMSLDNPDSGRGGNYDQLYLDESALIAEDIVTRVLRPMVRANKHRFEGNPYHHLFCDFTSMPWTVQGQWVLKTEENMKLYGAGRYFFVEGTTWDNVAVLGEDYIRQLLVDMHPLEAAIEIFNRRLPKVPNTFYPSFDERRHVDWLGKTDYVQNPAGLWTAKSRGTDDTLPLELACDFNAKIGVMLVAQDMGDRLRFCDEIFSTDKDKAEDGSDTYGIASENVASCLVKLFLERYGKRALKRLTVYGDRGGWSRSAQSNVPIYEQMQRELAAAGWQVSINVPRAYYSHKIKHMLIDKVLKGQKPFPQVEIDGQRCKYLIISLRNSGMNPDFTKNKKAEQLLVDQRTTTHASDAFDYILCPKYIRMEQPWLDATEVVFM